jgi:hypothetical protein
MMLPRDTCSHTPNAAAWLLHALPDDEAETFAGHLASGCPACRAEIDDLRLVVDVLPSGVHQVAPPPELKGRLMRVVRAEAELLQAAGPEADRPPRRARSGHEARAGRWTWRGLLQRPQFAAALACLLVAVGVGGGLALSGGGPDTRIVSAQTGVPGTARLVLTDGEEGVLELDGVPQAPGGGIYQVWLKRPGQDPVPSRTVFDVRPGGRASVRIAEPLEGVEAVLVTAEPSPGSPAPTSDPVITSNLT